MVFMMRSGSVDQSGVENPNRHDSTASGAAQDQVKSEPADGEPGPIDAIVRAREDSTLGPADSPAGPSQHDSRASSLISSPLPVALLSPAGRALRFLEPLRATNDDSWGFGTAPPAAPAHASEFRSRFMETQRPQVPPLPWRLIVATPATPRIIESARAPIDYECSISPTRSGTSTSLPARLQARLQSPVIDRQITSAGDRLQIDNNDWAAHQSATTLHEFEKETLVNGEEARAAQDQDNTRQKARNEEEAGVALIQDSTRQELRDEEEARAAPVQDNTRQQVWDEDFGLEPYTPLRRYGGESRIWIGVADRDLMEHGNHEPRDIDEELDHLDRELGVRPSMLERNDSATCSEPLDFAPLQAQPMDVLHLQHEMDYLDLELGVNPRLLRRWRGIRQEVRAAAWLRGVPSQVLSSTAGISPVRRASEVFLRYLPGTRSVPEGPTYMIECFRRACSDRSVIHRGPPPGRERQRSFPGADPDRTFYWWARHYHAPCHTSAWLPVMTDSCMPVADHEATSEIDFLPTDDSRLPHLAQNLFESSRSSPLLFHLDDLQAGMFESSDRDIQDNYGEGPSEPPRTRRPAQFIIGPDSSLTSPQNDHGDEGYEGAAQQAAMSERVQQMQLGNLAVIRSVISDPDTARSPSPPEMNGAPVRGPSLPFIDPATWLSSNVGIRFADVLSRASSFQLNGTATNNVASPDRGINNSIPTAQVNGNQINRHQDNGTPHRQTRPRTVLHRPTAQPARAMTFSQAGQPHAETSTQTRRETVSAFERSNSRPLNATDLARLNETLRPYVDGATSLTDEEADDEEDSNSGAPV